MKCYKGFYKGAHFTQVFKLQASTTAPTCMAHHCSYRQHRCWYHCGYRTCNGTYHTMKSLIHTPCGTGDFKVLYSLFGYFKRKILKIVPIGVTYWWLFFRCDEGADGEKRRLIKLALTIPFVHTLNFDTDITCYVYGPLTHWGRVTHIYASVN